MGAAKHRRIAQLAAQQGGVFRVDVITGAQKCAWCGERMKHNFVIGSEPGTLPGDHRAVVICFHCTGLNWTDESGKLVKIDNELRAQFDPSDLLDLDEAAEFYRQRKRERGEPASDPRMRS